LHDFATVSTSKIRIINPRLSTAEHVINVFVKANGFLAATRKNRGQISTAFAVCVVDPALTECDVMGFAAFLLQTLDQIMLCSALGSNRPVVYWRLCYSACSRDPRVNSWDWYFEPVNRGLESQVERVLCPVFADQDPEKLFQGHPDLRPILNNSFKNRTKVAGFENGGIITREVRLRINILIKQYVKPNSRITEKVETFYHRYLAGYTILGVHVRGTDHWEETNEHRLPPLMSWVKSAKTIFKTLPHPKKIFIASDNNEVIKKFVAIFGKAAVVFTKAIRAKSYHSQDPLHQAHFNYIHTGGDPYERVVGTQVLLDILLLAKCDHFLHAESSVASLASYFNPYMKSYFMEPGKYDKKEGKVRKKTRINDIRRKEQEDRVGRDQKEEDDDDDMAEVLRCFLRNSGASTCPDAAKGIFVNLEEARGFLKGH